jgi:DNA primase
MRIAPETVALINQQADILDVVQDFVSLKKKGTNYTACCPFHNEKTPSFSVSASKGIYKCFGCGKGGDSVSFVMDIENYTYIEALKYLAKKYNIELKTDENQTDEELEEQKERESLHIVLEFAQNYFKDLLHHSETGRAIGLSYFKERGFKRPIIDKFELGYSLAEWDGLLKTAENKGFKRDILEKAGLILQKENKAYDRFRERVIFPIHNVSGKPIAFGARILKNDPKQPKYLNSPETPVYHKSRVLYGIFQAKKTIREQDNCYLVEGYTDVVSLHQAGIENVVASSGTSLTIEQIQLIRRFSENITVLYDGDNAGIKASLRGIDLILTQGLNVKVVIFPDGDDPDSYLKKVGTTVFQKYLQEESQDFITFKANLYQSEARKDPLKRAEMIKEVVQSIIKIPDEIKRRVFFQECSRLLEINEETLIAEGNHLLRQEKPSQRPTFPSQEQIENTSEDTQIALTEEKEEERLSPVYSQEKAILRLLLLYPEFEIESISQKIGQFFYQELKDIQFENTLFKEIFEALCEAQNLSKPFQVSFFIQNSPENWKSFLVDLMTERFELSNQWKDKHNIYIPSEEEVLQQIVQEHVLRLKMNHILKLIQKNGQQLQQAKTESEQIKVMTLGIKLKQILTEIAGHLNNIVLKI